MRSSRNCFVIILLLVIVALTSHVEIDSKLEQKTDFILQPDSMTIGVRWGGSTGTAMSIYSAPLIIDLNHDGLSETLFYSWESYNDQRLLCCLNYDGTRRWSRNLFSNVGAPTPTVVDINCDGIFEILAVNYYTLYCLNPYNSIIWSYDFSTSGEEITTTPLLVKDSYHLASNKIVVFTNESICVFNVNGELYRRGPLLTSSDFFTPFLFNDKYTIGGVSQIADEIHFYNTDGAIEGSSSCRRQTRSPAISDLDYNYDSELIYQDVDGYIKCVSLHFGSLWTFLPNDMIDGPPAVADLDNDGSKEVLIKTEKSILCLDELGSLEWNYTRISNHLTYTSMAIADLDGDDTLEIIFSEYDANNLSCISHDGIIEWSYTIGSGLDSSPAIADLEEDGIVEIFIGAYGNLLCLEIPSISQSGNQSWSAYQGSIFHTGNIDSDGDLFDDYTESFYITDPMIRDTDSDLIPDGYEILYSFYPNIADVDGDALLDGEELYIYGTLPIDSDTDNDGAKDGEEILTYLTDPFNPDTDADGSLDGEELHLGVDGYTSDPFDQDTDNDGLLDGVELIYLSNPNSIDSDSDNLLDYDEVIVFGTDPANDDTENDGIDDYWEIQFGLDPLINDSYIDFDIDGLTALEEYTYDTDPFDSDTDDDLLTDGEEVLVSLTDPLLADTDGDSLTDGQEIHGYYSPSNPGANTTGYIHTNPLNPDSDGDSFIDSVEIFGNTDPNDPASTPAVETPPPFTITENITITTTVEAGIFFVSGILSVGTILLIAIVVIRKRKE